MGIAVSLFLAVTSAVYAIVSVFKKDDGPFLRYGLFCSVLIVFLQLAILFTYADLRYLSLLTPGTLVLIVLSLLVPVCYEMGRVLGGSGHITPRNQMVRFFYWGISGLFVMLEINVAFGITTLGNQEAGLFQLSYFLFFYLIVANILNLIFLEKNIRKVHQPGKTRVPLLFLVGSLILFVALSTGGLLTGTIHRPLLILLSVFVCGTYVSRLLLGILDRIGSQTFSLNRDFLYSSFMLIALGAYFIALGLVAKFVKVFGGNMKVFFSIITAGVVLTVFFKLLTSITVKETIKRFTDKSLFKERYDYRAVWSRFSETIAIHLEKEGLFAAILDTISEILQIQAAGLLVRNSEDVLVLAQEKNLGEGNAMQLHVKDDFCDWLWRFNHPIDLTSNFFFDEKRQSLGEFEATLLDMGLQVCVPLSTQNGLLGLLVLGKKNSEKSFSQEDLRLLETFANHSAIAIQNLNFQERLHDSKKMESFYKVTSFILHDLKNIVSSLSMLSDNARLYLDQPEFQKSAMQTLSSSVNRMKALLAKINIDGREGVLGLNKVNVNRTVQQTMESLEIPQGIHVDLRLQSVPDVLADSKQLEKVIVNLVINAIEAMPEGGDITISSSYRARLDVPHSEKGFGADEWVEICIEDTGVGMEDSFVNQQLFKPFRTTKTNGLGLGLYHCKEIIDALNGYIRVKSQINVGTTFSILLPVPTKLGVANSDNEHVMANENTVC